RRGKQRVFTAELRSTGLSLAPARERTGQAARCTKGKVGPCRGERARIGGPPERLKALGSHSPLPRDISSPQEDSHDASVSHMRGGGPDDPPIRACVRR